MTKGIFSAVIWSPRENSKIHYLRQTPELRPLTMIKHETTNTRPFDLDASDLHVVSRTVVSL